MRHTISGWSAISYFYPSPATGAFYRNNNIPFKTIVTCDLSSIEIWKRLDFVFREWVVSFFGSVKKPSNIPFPDQLSAHTASQWTCQLVNLCESLCQGRYLHVQADVAREKVNKPEKKGGVSVVSDEVLKDIKMIMTVMMRLTTTQTGQIPISANINFLALKLARGDDTDDCFDWLRCEF